MRNGRRAIARGRRLPLFLDHHRGKSKVVAPRCAQGLPMTLSRLGQAKRTPHQSSHLARVVSFESRLRMTPRFSRNPPWEASDNASGKRQRIRKRRHQTQSLFREGDVFCTRRWNSRPRSGGMGLLRGGVKVGRLRGCPFRGSEGVAGGVSSGGVRSGSAVRAA